MAAEGLKGLPESSTGWPAGRHGCSGVDMWATQDGAEFGVITAREDGDTHAGMRRQAYAFEAVYQDPCGLQTPCGQQHTGLP
jgi:hypothetical protein